MFLWSRSQFPDCDSQRDSSCRQWHVRSQHYGFCADRQYPPLWHVFIPCQSHRCGGYSGGLRCPDADALCPGNDALVAGSHQNKNWHLPGTSEHFNLQLFLGRSDQDQLSRTGKGECKLKVWLTSYYGLVCPIITLAQNSLYSFQGN
jgi:hypothetical protein